jgi:uncharacterized protein YggU (UPF0235/DUF167 family)
VVPGASRDEIAGWLGDALKVRVAAAPERGRANDAVVRLVAAALGVPAAQVRVAAGTGSPRKTLEIDGLTDAQVRERLAGSDREKPPEAAGTGR